MNEAVFRDYRFDALRNALYHTARKSFLDFINRVINFFVIVFGASVVGKTAGHFPFDGLYLELATVIFATLQLVFDFGSKARLHEFLQRRYYDLLSEMKNDGSTDSKEQKKIFEKMLALAGEEPLTMRALDALAYNQALDALHDDPEIRLSHRQTISWWQKRFRNCFAFHSIDFQNRQ